ncbi:MAG TPA: Gfo/Idh/MocA family oxidoreductase [Gaiellaceae bacterium]|nr:Gfo/Idh/MocA family oxidoreductase [Gaiellaceae bacterium]
MSTQGRPRIGVVGTGWWSIEHHVPSLLGYEGAELAALADTNPEKLARVASHFGVERTFADAEELFVSGLVDGVMIAVPHAHHYPLARAALDAGLHVFLEKPMTLASADAWDLVERAERAGLQLTVGYTFQYTRAAQRLKRLFDEGTLGELLAVSGIFASIVEAYYRGRPDDYASVFDFSLAGPDPQTYSDPKLAGGGQAATQITHAMGLVLYVTGLAPTKVMAFMRNGELEVDLVDAIAYELSGGAVGTMAAAGTIRPGQDLHEEARYFGSEGNAVHRLAEGTLEIALDDGTTERVALEEGESVYPAEAPARGFADLIAGRGPNLAPAVPAARTVAFVEAAYRSAASGQPVAVEPR